MLYHDLNCLWIVLRILRDIWYDFDDATTWHISMYKNYMMKLYNDFIWWWDVMRTWWWLRSTTGPYGRVYDKGCIWGEYDSLHQGCLEDISSKRVVGVSSWCITHVRHTRVNTSVDIVYDYFSFLWYKIYMYYVLKSICIIKEYWWSLTSS